MMFGAMGKKPFIFQAKISFESKPVKFIKLWQYWTSKQSSLMGNLRLFCGTSPGCIFKACNFVCGKNSNIMSGSSFWNSNVISAWDSAMRKLTTQMILPASSARINRQQRHTKKKRWSIFHFWSETAYLMYAYESNTKEPKCYYSGASNV